MSKQDSNPSLVMTKNEKVKAKLRLSSSPVMDDAARFPSSSDDAALRPSSSRSQSVDAARPSIFLLMYFLRNDNRDYSILQLETQSEHGDDRLHEKAVCFKVPPQCQSARWFFSLPTSCSSTGGDMYMLPARYLDEPLQAYKFDFRTAEFRKIKLPRSYKWQAHVVNLKGRIYYMERPDIGRHTTAPVFECYEPNQDSWEALKRFPNPPLCSRIRATAVWDDKDIILYNIASLRETPRSSPSSVVDSCNIWAYDVCLNEWYKVHVDDSDYGWCCSIIQEAIVLHDTIYALTNVQFDLVLALSIEKEEIDNGDVVFKCSLLSKILMPGMKPIISRDDAWHVTKHLIHLGEDKFCFVQSYEPMWSQEIRPVQVNYMKLEGEKMRMMDECVHELKIQCQHFQVLSCFTLPKGMAKALQGNRFDFELHPRHEVEKVLKKEFGPNSIHVTNLPRNMNATLVEKVLNKEFGPIKRGMIQLGKKEKGICYAYVEFESATSKQRAIEASTITFGNCEAKILKK